MNENVAVTVETGYRIRETGASWSISVIFENMYYLSVTNLNKLHVIWLSDIQAATFPQTTFDYS